MTKIEKHRFTRRQFLAASAVIVTLFLAITAMSQTAVAKGIDGTVMLAGQPLGGATVTLWQATGKEAPKSLAEVSTDASGGFKIRDSLIIEIREDRARAEGMKVSTTQLTFMSPLEPGLKEIFSRFKKVMTVEINYSDTVGDPYITEETRRYGQLAWLLRAHTLVDIDCWTSCPGQPLRPNDIYNSIIAKSAQGDSK